MLLEIKNRVEQEIINYFSCRGKLYSLNKISPILFKNIKGFILRKGKRIRPILFIIGYLGFAKKAAPGLYRSAASFEFLHDFMLVHDDIIDKSPTRRGKPAMHEMLNKYLKRYKNIKFNGQDLTIVIGDIMYAMAIDAFLSIKEDLQRKETALKKLTESAIYTGTGEFIDILSAIKNLDEITKEDIYKIYDYKTANYSFATPLAIGATLSGASQTQINRLFKYGIYLGRAFQIKDDILSMFGDDKKIGKSTLTDLQGAKKTILIWQAYHKSNKKEKSAIESILLKKDINKIDLLKIREFIVESGTLDYVRKEISIFLKRAQDLSVSSKMHPRYKNLLSQYSSILFTDTNKFTFPATNIQG